MLIRVKDKTGQYASFESLYQVETDEQAGVTQKRMLVPDSVVPWSITELATEHVKITHARSRIEQDLVLRTEQEGATVGLFVQLSGHSLIRRCHQADRRYQSGQCNLVYAPAYEGELRLSGPVVSTFAVQFSTRYLRQFLDERVGFLDQLAESMDKGHPHPLTPHNPSVTRAMNSILHDLLHCPFKGFSKRLYLEAKLLELLALQVEQLETGRPFRTTALRPDDIDKLMAAKAWLTEHFLRPITLSEVVRLVGLNEFKLKRGFRVMFNTTVFGYLTELRMNHARQLLLDCRRTVTEVADALNYQHVHHFTHAFRKHFGYPPSQLRP